MRAPRPRVLGHRGASGHRPENSLAAFREAIRLGADGVELDVQTTSCGRLVVYHDWEVPGLGPIAGLRFETLREAWLSNGEPIPSLEEALEEIQGAGGAGGPSGGRAIEVWIELKSLPRSADGALLQVIEGSPAPARCAVHSFDHRIVARLGEKRPMLRRGILSASYPLDPVGPMQAAGANTLWQEWHLVDGELVAAVHRSGGEVMAWTVNDAEAARRLAELGVDGLCGNWPERLRVR